jgi:alpha-ketoglutarate-dependent taurine dioxygenase
MLTSNTMNSIQPFGMEILLQGKDELFAIEPSQFSDRLSKEKLLLIRGVPLLTKQELVEFSANLNPNGESIEDKLLHWDFGAIMEMRQQEEATNYLFSNEKVPFHWDGAFVKAPSYLLFNCVQAPKKDEGGETLFTYSEHIYADLSSTEKEQYKKISLSYETEKKAHYGGMITVPLIDKHPQTGKPILRMAEEVETKLNPVKLTVHGCDFMDTDEFVKQMTERLYNPKYCYAHQWQVNDILLADNHSLLHGRHAFLKSATRHFRRVQIL